MVLVVAFLICLCSAAPSNHSRDAIESEQMVNLTRGLIENIRNNRYAFAVMPGENIGGYSVSGGEDPVNELIRAVKAGDERMKRNFWEWLENAFMEVANFVVDILGLNLIPRTMCGCFDLEYLRDAAFILLGPVVPTIRVFEKIADGITLLGYDDLPAEQQEEVRSVCNCTVYFSYPDSA